MKNWKFRKRIIAFLFSVWAVIAMTGCGFTSEEEIKLRDLDFTILSEEVVPEELQKLIDEKKENPFQLTYVDDGNLYICAGYGQQATGGYSITVNELYLTDNAIYVNTSLLGPEKGANEKSAVSYPYIVIKTEKLDETVIFR